MSAGETKGLIIMYSYHAFSNARSTHMIHINLNIILYTHVEHLPKQFTYSIIWKHTHTHTHTHTRAHSHAYNDCSRNWVLILVRMEIL